MRICYLADAGSIHIHKRIRYFTQKGHDVHLISFREGKIDGVKLHYIKPIIPFSDNLSYIVSIPRIRNLINVIKPDFLHAFYATSYGFMGARCKFKPFIISCIGSDIMLNTRKIGMYRSITKYALKKASFITSVSRPVTEKIIQLGIDSKRVRTVTFGIDPQQFFPAPQNEKKFALISVRRFEPVYNIETLLRCHALLMKESFKRNLVLIGGGFNEKYLKQLANNLGILEQVDFMGAVPHDEVAEYLRASQIYISMSLSDGASTSLLEAMACGAFPIVSDIPANREWVVDGENGFLVSPRDSEKLARRVRDAFSNPHLMRTAIQKNVEMIQKRAILEKNLREIENLYQIIKEGKW